MKKDKIIIGAGLYGLYSALFCAKQGDDVLVLECDNAPFQRASYINQARVHMGYHYPRSISTAIKSRGYFDRFNSDFGFCVHDTFEKIYAISSSFSWTSSQQFQKFCENADIPCRPIDPNIYFKNNMCDGAFITKEYTYDAQILKKYLLEEIKKYTQIKIIYNSRIDDINKDCSSFSVQLVSGERFETPFILNATYSGANQIHNLMKLEPFKMKYELCEVILCNTNENLQNVGITVMDGPFFSVMPFGKTGLHSLTSVTFTPHSTSYNELPSFKCQENSKGYCTPAQLGNCNNCTAKPQSAWRYMKNLAIKYLNQQYEFYYNNSLFSMKPILKSSEIDDSRPTVLRVHSETPKFVSVLSGKINTVYDLDEVLKND